MSTPEPLTGNAAKLAYSIPEAAAAIGLSRSRLYLHIKSGGLRATKIGGRTVILANHLTDWLNSFADSPKAAASHSPN